MTMTDTFTTPPPIPPTTDSYDPIGITQQEVRLAMVANGYNPTPLVGKRPVLDEWQRINATAPLVQEWSDRGSGTGMVTALSPVFDVDILDEQAAQIAGATIRRLLG